MRISNLFQSITNIFYWRLFFFVHYSPPTLAPRPPSLTHFLGVNFFLSLLFQPLSYFVLFSLLEYNLTLFFIEEKFVLYQERIFDDFFRLGGTLIFLFFWVDFGSFEIFRNRVGCFPFEEIEGRRWWGVILLWDLG